MQEEWISQWIMELAAETAAYAHLYEQKAQNPKLSAADLECWMDKWMQYRILRHLGEKRGCGYKRVTFNHESGIVEPEKLLYNEMENCNQFQAVYEAVTDIQKPLMLRVMFYQQAILRRLGNGG